MKTYRIFAAHHDDMHEGWVWLQCPCLPPRSVVKITNAANRKSVYCESLQIDDNFEREYNAPAEEGRPQRYPIADRASTLVIGAWYRAGLGELPTQENASLTIRAANGPWGHVWAGLGHPQAVARLATKLGLIGVVLGLIALWPAIKEFLLWSLAAICRIAQ
jgi:hypothetical protein